jgi:hypothetical protein
VGIISRSTGGGGGGLGSLAFDSTLGAPAVIIDSGATIATTGTLLVVRWLARTDEAVTGSSLLVRVNGSSGALYDRQFVQGAGAVAAANTALAATSWVVTAPGNTAAAGVFGAGRLECHGYGGTVQNPKMFECVNRNADQVAAQMSVALYAFGFRSAAAINQVSIAPGGGTNLATGSRLSVYVF